jgi:hypothetical protein
MGRPGRSGSPSFENPVAARFWRLLAAEIGSNVKERLQPVPDKPHIPDDVILSFSVS